MAASRPGRGRTRRGPHHRTRRRDAPDGTRLFQDGGGGLQHAGQPRRARRYLRVHDLPGGQTRPRAGHQARGGADQGARRSHQEVLRRQAGGHRGVSEVRSRRPSRGRRSHLRAVREAAGVRAGAVRAVGCRQLRRQPAGRPAACGADEGVRLQTGHRQQHRRQARRRGVLRAAIRRQRQSRAGPQGIPRLWESSAGLQTCPIS